MSTISASTSAEAGSTAAVAATNGDVPAVRLTALSKRYGDLLALDDVSLSIAPGEFLAILGPSGSGKTTTMRMIGGFEAPDSGMIEIGGHSVLHLPPYKRDVNTVFQSYALFPNMTVEDNVAYGLKMKGVPKKQRRARAAEMLDLVQLGHSRVSHPGQLSGGMQQRVALARALINDPQVLLLDEPLSALDRKLREDMQLELRRIQAVVGVTFVYVTHDQEEALSMADRIAVMRHGRIEQIGAPADVYDRPESLWVADFVGTSSHLAGKVTAIGEVVRIETDVATLTAGYASTDVRVGERAIAVVRPESVFVSVGAEAVTNPNQVRVTVEEILNMGPQAKIVARTAGGIQLVARGPRTELSPEVAPGKEVTMHFRREGVRVYRPDPDIGGVDREGAPS